MSGPNYGATRILQVESVAGPYLYKSNIGPEAVLTACGVTEVNLAAIPAGAFLAANSPKPPRATQSTPLGSNSTFCDKDNITALKLDGWTITQGRVKAITSVASASKVVTCYVLVDGVRYAWNMNRVRYTRITDELTALGVETATAADRNTLVWGATVPKPAIAAKFFEAGTDGGDTVSCFVSSAKEADLPEGWKIIKPSITKATYFG